MQTSAHWDGGGPGPWILSVPLIRAAGSVLEEPFGRTDKEGAL
ncbi:hypothetical protein ACH40E_04460 [Streptomyces acidicola]